MNNRGFTLVELLVALGVCIVIISAIYAAVTTGQRSSSAMLQKVVAHQDARAALELMATEIQMASFNPTRMPGIWITPTGACTAISANQNARGIQEATATSIAVEMDIGTSGAIGDSTNEVIRYAYLPGASDQRLTRSTNCFAAQHFLGSNVAGQKTVRVINDINGNGTMDAGDIPVFRYYTALGIEIPVANFLNPAASPNIRDIAHIEITLAVETEDIAADTGQRRQMIYSTSILPRNHVIP